MQTIKEVLVLHHTHTDIGFTHPQPIIWEMERRFIDQALDLCDETADWPDESRMRWTCEVTAPVVDWLNRSRPGQIERFRRLVDAGQIACGAMPVNITPLMNAEELAQALLPVRRLRNDFGLPLKAAIQNDINGLPWPLTELLLDSGIELVMMGINIHYGGFPLTRPLGFRWQTPDGREILAWNGEHYGTFDRLCRTNEQRTDLISDGLAGYFKRLEQAKYPYDFVYLTSTHPKHGDNNPPNPELPELIRRYNAEQREPIVRFATPEMLLERLKAQPIETLPKQRGDWTDFWNFGSGSAALETGVNRNTRSRLLAAQLLQTRRTVVQSDVLAQTADAFTNVALYHEHTWGAPWPGLPKLAPMSVSEQWSHKSHYAWMGRTLTSLLLRDELDSLARNPKHARGLEGLLVYNPAPFPRTAMVVGLRAWLDDDYRLFESSKLAIDSVGEMWQYGKIFPPDESNHFGIVDLPASGYRMLTRDEVSALPMPPEGRIGDGEIESPTHRLTFETDTGRITGLWDKQLGRQVIDTGSEWNFFCYVHEQPAPGASGIPDRHSIFKPDWENIYVNESCWQTDWVANRLGPRSLLECRTEQTKAGPSLFLRWAIPGATEFEQRITLCTYRPVVELIAKFNKSDSRLPESTFFAFPLALPNWRAHFDTADIPVEYIAEQIPGSCRDYVTAGSYVSVHNAEACVTLATIDAPLAHIGGFNFGRLVDDLPRESSPLLLSWLTNNHWDVNFRISQPGTLSFRYEVRTSAAFDPVAAAQAGIEANVKTEVHPIVTMSNERLRQLAQVEGEGVILLHVKLAAMGAGLIMRLVNVTADTTTASISIPGRTIASAHLSNPLEEIGARLTIIDGAAQVQLASRQIVTVYLQVAEESAAR